MLFIHHFPFILLYSMRTLAVVLPSYTPDRLAIESALIEQNAEILKERAMHLEPSAYLEELFPNAPMEAMTEDKVWVYVLESADRIELGPGVVISPDEELAEAQISALFASSPVFSDEPVSPSNSSRPSLSSSSFKARPAPVTTHSPTIVPRTTKAALLRQSSASSGGGLYHAPVGKPRESLAKERIEQTFEGVPGHKRRESVKVKSTVEKPKVEPRLTKAAMLRLGIEVEKKPRPVSVQVQPEKKQIEHKRSSSFSVPPPSIAPRLNRSATLRTQPKAPPSSFMCMSFLPCLTISNSRSQRNADADPVPVASHVIPVHASPFSPRPSPFRPTRRLCPRRLLPGHPPLPPRLLC